MAEQIKNSTTYFGYPEVPENYDLSILGISSLAKMHLNNAGDPWVHGNAKMHTKEFEREALGFVARLYGIENRYWGYITSGGTEGNLYGMYTGREYFTAHMKKALFLYAESSHYSLAKNARLLNLESKVINACPSGEMDYENLQSVFSQLQQSKGTDLGIIINLNIGTTMTGAIDTLKKVNSSIDKSGISRKNILIHADAALLGFIYPFLEDREVLFENGVSSIAISGHKFHGAIHPCGIVLTDKSVNEIAFEDQWVP